MKNGKEKLWKTSYKLAMFELKKYYWYLNSIYIQIFAVFMKLCYKLWKTLNTIFFSKLCRYAKYAITYF